VQAVGEQDWVLLLFNRNLFPRVESKASMAESPARESILSFEEARRAVQQQAAALRPGRTEQVALEDAAGRILAQDIAADRDLPPFPRSTRDGYAVRSADVAEVPAALRVIGEIPAGTSPNVTILRGQAAEIMTGAALPPGADAVVMVERTRRRDDQVEVLNSVSHGENVVPAGAEARQGDVLLRSESRITPAAVAVAASVGAAQIRVFTRPRVAILATGDELVEVTEQPGPVQIRNSNSYSLAAQVAGAGAVPMRLPIVRDTAESLRHGLTEGLRHDLLLLAGGVSAGKYDLVEPVLAEMGGEFLFTGTLIQPGRPLVFGRIVRSEEPSPVCFFGLPGNPVSTYVTFHLFVRPVIAALAGAAPEPLLFLKARLKQEVRTRTGLTRFLPALLSGEFERSEVELLPWQGSGDVVAAARANCLIVVPPDRESMAAGEMVSVLPVA
jgi:molybdopterin molybdotransferase